MIGPGAGETVASTGVVSMQRQRMSSTTMSEQEFHSMADEALEEIHDAVEEALEEGFEDDFDCNMSVRCSALQVRLQWVGRCAVETKRPCFSQWSLERTRTASLYISRAQSAPLCFEARLRKGGRIMPFLIA